MKVTKRSSIERWAMVLVVVLMVLGAEGHQRVPLKDVSALTMRKGELTSARRTSPIPQLTCIGGTARGAFEPDAVQCTQVGFDGLGAQWKCEADLPNNMAFGQITVSCEGYEYPDDPFILAGSCGLEYELKFTSPRENNNNNNNINSHRESDFGYRRGEKPSRTGSYTHPSSSSSSSSSFATWLMVAVVAFIMWGVCSSRQSQSGGGPAAGGRPVAGPPHIPRNDARPPNNNNDNNGNDGTFRGSSYGAGNNGFGSGTYGGFPKTRQQTSAPSSGSGIGGNVASGLAGAGIGYLLGSRGRRSSPFGRSHGPGFGGGGGWGGSRGGMGSGSGWGGGSSFGGSSRSGGGGGSSSAGTSRSTGYGGTSRR